MATLSPAQIYTLAINAGLSPMKATTATAVALAESGGRTDAEGDVGIQTSKWGPSIGLWQVRSVKAEYGTGGTRDASRLKDPAFNAASMVSISGTGGNWRPWSVFTSGSYKKYLAQVPDDGAGIFGPGFGGLIDTGPTAHQQVTAAVNTFKSEWANDAMTVGLKILGGAAAAGLVIVGAVHTVSSK